LALLRTLVPDEALLQEFLTRAGDPATLVRWLRTHASPEELDAALDAIWARVPDTAQRARLMAVVERPGSLADYLERVARPTELEQAIEKTRVHALGQAPATGRHRPAESETAVRVEEARGVVLTRAPKGSSADWVDQAGETYDAVGNFPGKFFEQQWPQLQHQIRRHLDKADWVPVDVSKFDTEQIDKVDEFIDGNELGPRVFIVGK